MVNYKDKIKIKKGFIYAVMVFLTDSDDNLLLLKRSDNDKYEPVKGGINEDEDEKSAAIREVFEETGIKISNLSLIKRLDDVLTTSEGVTLIKGAIFKTKLKEKRTKVYLSEEHYDYMWVDNEKLKNIILYPPAANKYKTCL